MPGGRIDEPSLREYAADRAAVQATLARTEEIIEELEAELKAAAPKVAHVTIEVQGIVSGPSGGDLPA